MDEQLAKIIGSVARRARTQAKLTQADVAERLGLVPEVYGRLERGLMLPSVTTLRKLSRTLAVPTDVLLGLDAVDSFEAPPLPPGFGESPEVRRLVRRAGGLGMRKLRLVILLVTALAHSGGP